MVVAVAVALVARATRNALFLTAVSFPIMLLVVAAPAAFGAPPSAALPVQQFASPLVPSNAGAVPPGYLFGGGVWSGTVYEGFTRMNFTVTLAGAMPDTKYQVSVVFYNSTGGSSTRSYGLLKTGSEGSGVFTASSQIFSGTVEIGLCIADATNFNPPLQVLTADPSIGRDVVT